MATSVADLANIIYSRCRGIDFALPSEAFASTLRRHYSVLELGMRSNAITAEGLSSVLQSTPDDLMGSRTGYPLCDLFLERLRVGELQRPEITFHGDFVMALESYLEIAEDWITNAWLQFLNGGNYGTIDPESVRPYLRAGRLPTRPEEDEALRELVNGAETFVEQVSSSLMLFDELDRDAWILIFFKDVKQFFGIAEDNRDVTAWSQLIPRSLAVHPGYELPEDQPSMEARIALIYRTLLRSQALAGSDTATDSF